MEIVSHSPNVHHPMLEVITINGEQVNGSFREDVEVYIFSMYAEHDLYDYYGVLLRSFADTREKFKIVAEWIQEQYKQKLIEHKSGWSTRTQYWSEWTIHKN